MQNFYTKKQGRNSLLYCAKSRIIQLVFFSLLAFPVAAQNYIVNSNTDANAVNFVTGETATPGQITLRSAIQAATAQPGAHIITFSGAVVSPINLTLGQITVGNAANGNNITITGPGMNSLTVNQTTENRIFSTGTGAVTFLLQDITLNYTGPAVMAYSGGGGAIIAGGAGAATTLLNCRITNFQRQLGNGGAISASSSLANHSLTITNCIFTNNRAGGAGGAVSFNSQGGTATITGCTFDNNHTGPVGANTGGDGGAVSTTGGGSGGTYLIEKNTFLNNQVENVTGHAGAIMNTNGTLTVRFNRFIGNTCLNVANPPLANIIGQAGGATIHTTIADNNWWGVNTGPGANDVTALAAGAVITLTKWLQLKTTASPNLICNTAVGPGNTSLVTTSFLSNSASEAILVSNLPVLIGLPVTWTSTLGNLSGQQATIQASGTATATFTSNGTGGGATVNTQVDNVPAGETSPARANITVNSSSIAPTGATGTTTVCSGVSTTLTVTGGTKGTGASTEWFTGSCGGTLVFTGDAFTTPVLFSNTSYFVRYSGICNITTCAIVTVTVNEVTGGTVESDQTICTGGDPAAFTESVASTGSGTLTYQWQSSTTSCASGFSNIGGAMAATYDAPSGLASTTYYRRVTTSTFNAIPCTANSNCITVTVNSVTGGTVATDQTVCSGGDPAAFTQSIASTGSGTLTYQWQSSTTSCASGFSNIGGAIGTTHDVPAGLLVTTYYRRVTTSTLDGVPCTANSNCITVTVNDVTGGTVGSDQALLSPADPALFTQLVASTGSGTLTYQWQSSTTSCASGFSNIGGANGTTYDAPAGLTVTTYYRRVTISTLSGVPCVATSNCITVTVITCSITRTSAVGTDAQTVCNNTPITDITYSTTSATGATFSGLPAGVTGNWAANVVTISGTPTVYGPYNYTVTLTGGGCGAFSASGSITVNANPVVSITPAGPVAICAGDNVTLTASATCNNFAFSGLMSGTQEVPSNASTARAVFNGTFNSSNNQLTITVVFDGLTGGNATAAHIHNAGPGVAGPVIIPLTGFPAATGGSYTNTFVVPGAQVANLMAGNTYINIHNATFPGGEIRGQIVNLASNVYTLSGSISGTQEVPPNASTATGNFAGTYDNNTSQLTLNMIFNNLTGGNATAAHVHNAGPGINGPVIIPLTGFPAATSGTYSNTFTMPPAQVANFLAGNTYVNIHNAVFPGGEVRGQIAAPAAVCTGASYLWSPGGAITPSITVSTANTYTVTVTDVNGCSNNASVVVNVNPIPNAVATPASQTICSGTSITTIVLSGAVGGTTYNWTRDNTGAVTGIAASGAGNIAGTLTNTTSAPLTVTFTITPTANGCPGPTTTATVLVNPTPNAVATPSSQTVCSATPITTIVLSGAVSGTTFNWTRDNTVNVTGIATPGSGNISGTLTNTTSTPQTVTFTITPTANGCPGTPITATVLVNPTPNAVATPSSQTICSANPITTIVLSGSVSGTTYTWTSDNTGTVTGIASSGSGNISGTLTNTTFAPITVTFTITPTANGCPGAPITATVLVNPTPNAVATPSSQTICSANPITTIVLSGSVSGTTYAWTRNNTATVTGIAASGAGNISGTLTNTTSAPVTVTFTITPTANGCVGPTTTATVLVNPTPNAVATPASQTICNNTAITTIVLSGSVSGTTYAWTRNNTVSVTGIAANGTGNISGTLTNTTNAPVTVTFTITPTANGCPGPTTTATVTVNPTPTVDPVANQTICNGTNTAAIIFNGAVAGTVYSWTNNTTSIGLGASGTGILNPVSATTTMGSGFGTSLNNTINGAGLSSFPSYNAAHASVNPANSWVSAGATTGSITFDLGGSFVMNGFAFWNQDAGGPGATGSSGIRDVQVLSSTDGITFTPIAGAPATFARVTGTNAPPQTFGFAPITASFVRFIVLNNHGDVGQTGFAEVAFSRVRIPSFTATNTTTTPVTATITVTPTFYNNGIACVGTPSTFTITVNPTPTITCPANITVPSVVGACTAVVTYAPTVTGAPTPTLSYLLTGATTGSGSGTGSGTAFRVGVTTVTITATNICATVSCSFTVTVTDSQLPVITAQPVNRTVCAGASATFSVTAITAPSAGGPLSYQWQLWNGSTWNNITGATSSSYTVSGATVAMNTNSYRAVVTGLCTVVNSTHATLYVNPLPTINLTTSIPPNLLPTQVLTITVTTAPSGGNYVWFKNGVAIAGASGSTLANLTVSDIGTYRVVYTDPNGCVATSSDVVITGQPSDNLYVYPVPNNGVFNVRFYNQSNELVTLRVIDAKGSEVYRKKVQTTIPYTTMNVDLTTNRIFTSGVYVVEIRGADGRQVGARRIIVSNQ